MYRPLSLSWVRLLSWVDNRWFWNWFGACRWKCWSRTPCWMVLGVSLWRLWRIRTQPSAFHPVVYFVSEFLMCGLKVDQIIRTLSLFISVIPVETFHIQEIFCPVIYFSKER